MGVHRRLKSQSSIKPPEPEAQPSGDQPLKRGPRPGVRRLVRDQATTLFAIVTHRHHNGQAPSPKLLAALLGIDEDSASHRIHRLRKKAYLVTDQFGTHVNEAKVVTQQLTARLLLRIAEEGGRRAPLSKTQLGELAQDRKIGLRPSTLPRIVEIAIEQKYLVRVKGWDQSVLPGPQIANEAQYLQLLAWGSNSSKTVSRNRARKTNRSRKP